MVAEVPVKILEFPSSYDSIPEVHASIMEDQGLTIKAKPTNADTVSVG